MDIVSNYLVVQVWCSSVYTERLMHIWHFIDPPVCTIAVTTLGAYARYHLTDERQTI